MERARFDEAMAALRRQVLEGPAETTPGVRQSAFAGRSKDLPGELVTRVRRGDVPAELVEQARLALGDGAVFELIVAASLGATVEETSEALTRIDEAWSDA